MKNSNIQVGLAQMRGNKIVELDYKGYKRRNTYFWNWITNPESGLVGNLFTINFSNAKEDWGYVTHVLFFRNNKLLGNYQIEESLVVDEDYYAGFVGGALVTDLL